MTSISRTESGRGLAGMLDRRTARGVLWQTENGKVRCQACGHRCLLAVGQRGICKVRFNRDGQMHVPFGYVAGVACDPIEKKPFFHVYPGSDALTFGMLGCDFHCAFCQNWITSQAMRDPQATAPIQSATAPQLAAAAVRSGARLVVSSYNEPLITAEWAAAVFQEASQAGLLCAFVSNGNATPEVLNFLQPWTKAFKVDLKCFNDRHYRSLGGTLQNVTNTIGLLHQLGFWVEVVTLLVPGFNDSNSELHDLTKFLASVSCDIPWHVTAFHPDYKMTDPRPTAADDLLRAARIGHEEGLRFVYAGNLAGRVSEWENTRCPGCGETLVERHAFSVRRYAITPQGACPRCSRRIPGLWPAHGAEEVRLSGTWRVPRGVDLKTY